MVKEQTHVYARVRPLSVEEQARRDEISYEVNQSEVGVPKFLTVYSNETRYTTRESEYTFPFEKVFGDQSDQREIFEDVALPALQSLFDGFNATIFAYGQTGSGKTYTLTGGETYQERGIIPRVITELYKEVKRREECEFHVYITYIEVYNEEVYDLLDRRHQNKTLDKWMKIKLMNDAQGNLHLVNLSVQECPSELEALDILFQGNQTRVTSETPMNQVSSRSHCIFSIVLETRNSDETTFVSKLNLVDLAGSERVYKHENSSKTKKEGKYINLSLHYLEQVINSLYDRSLGKASHIPYRNSVMTNILSDSLGGNCKTIFITTINPQKLYCDESISTCRFAQRCSLLKKEITPNKAVDLQKRIRYLENENAELKSRIDRLESSLISGGFPADVDDELTPELYESCKQKVAEYLRPSEEGDISISSCREAVQIIKLLKLNALMAATIATERGKQIEELTAQLREFVLSADKSRLIWRKMVTLEVRGNIKLSSIDSVVPGCARGSFLMDSGQKDPTRCFSLRLRNGTSIDLEVVADSEDAFHTLTLRNLWISIFMSLIHQSKILDSCEPHAEEEEEEEEEGGAEGGEASAP